MIKVYIPKLNDNLSKIGGGFTFLRNLCKGLSGKVEFVDNWVKSDIVFIFGITTIDKNEVISAINAGKKLVLRVDNIPRKSRNKRQSPADRLTEFGNKADMVVYQSEWCKEYAGYFIEEKLIVDKPITLGPTECPNGTESYKNSCIINNGVDKSIFNTDDRDSDGKTFLYINYNDNPNKRFDEALYWFDMAWRRDNSVHLVIAGNVPGIYLQHPEYNWDVPTNASIEYAGVFNEPEEVAALMKSCDFLLYPSFAEAYPNTVLEAMACGMEPECICFEGGTSEAYNNSKYEDGIIGDPDGEHEHIEKINVKSIEEMSNEYLEIFNKLL